MECQPSEVGCDDELIDIDAIKMQLGIQRTKIYDMIGKGEFPAPVKIGSASRWVRGEVRAWLVARKAERANRAA